jgi:glycosyltransferase involved in cell wall biosynthesis
MKLIIQIPCLDEEEALPVTLADLPREVPGFERVEWLVIDDGSTDGTVEVARAHGVDHVVRLGAHRGLAAAFQAGLEAALALGADVIVNTDADNQYRGGDVARLTAPILGGSAGMVVGDRGSGAIEHFSPLKRVLHRLGSWAVRRLLQTELPDVTSGFRAYGRETAAALRVGPGFTHTLETIRQASRLGIAVAHVPVRTNPSLRRSRLAGSPWAYVGRTAVWMCRAER